MGDSITYGYPVAGGWRTQLYQDLNPTGTNYAFVGSQTSNPSTLLTSVNDTNHDGFPGIVINNLLPSVSTDVATGRPTDILLQIGINDILGRTPLVQNEADISNLVHQIYIADPSTHVFIASILPSINISFQPQIEAYNAYIADAVVPIEQGLGMNITFVDQYANFVDSTDTPIISLYDFSNGTGDIVHPDLAGYIVMANTWNAAITASAIPEPSPVSLILIGGAICAAFVQIRRRI